MAIFNSYVKLPEGILGYDIACVNPRNGIIRGHHAPQVQRISKVWRIVVTIVSCVIDPVKHQTKNTCISLPRVFHSHINLRISKGSTTSHLSQTARGTVLKVSPLECTKTMTWCPATSSPSSRLGRWHGKNMGKMWDISYTWPVNHGFPEVYGTINELNGGFNSARQVS